jgi:hypothetical protein
MRIQGLYVGTFPRFIRNTESCWRVRLEPMYARAHAHAYPHTPTHTRTRAHTGRWSKQTEHCRGGAPAVCVHTTWRNVWRRVSFLATLSHISRSDPRPPTRSAYAPASPLSPCLPAPRHTNTQSRPSDRPLQHQVTTPTPTRIYSNGACLFPSGGQGVCT